MATSDKLPLKIYLKKIVTDLIEVREEIEREKAGYLVRYPEAVIIRCHLIPSDRDPAKAVIMADLDEAEGIPLSELSLTIGKVE